MAWALNNTFVMFAVNFLPVIFSYIMFALGDFLLTVSYGVCYHCLSILMSKKHLFMHLTLEILGYIILPFTVELKSLNTLIMDMNVIVILGY